MRLKRLIRYCGLSGSFVRIGTLVSIGTVDVFTLGGRVNFPPKVVRPLGKLVLKSNVHIAKKQANIKET